MIGGIIVGHGDFGDAMISMITKINGEADCLFGISNTGKSTAELVDDILAKTSADCSDRVFLFVDLFGGSCWQASKIVKTRAENVHILTGANLPMMLSFLHKRETMDFDELSVTLAADAVRGITAE